jgi:branched-chain amino acid transport system ATP-binding protein
VSFDFERVELTDVSRHFGRRRAISHVSLAAEAGEILGFLGPNGAGKSTLIKAIAGLTPIASGRVTLAGRDITHLPAHLMVRHGLAFTPQTENVFGAMSVDDNLRLAAGVLAAALRARRIAETYDFFPDLARQRGLLAGRLSGGQRQMLAVARALLAGLSVLMLDEPSAGLSPKLVDSVFAKLVDIRAAGVAIILVEQNARAALAIADRAYVLVEGRNRHEGRAADLVNDPVMAKLYLGGLRADASRSAMQ